MPTPNEGETRDHFMNRCIPQVLQDGAAEDQAQAVAMCANIWKRKKEDNMAEITEKARVMKTEVDGKHPASHYLVVIDPNEVGTWHLRVRNVRGELDHRLMGAAWAALHQGYRGNKYKGPKKQEAIAKLRKLYKREGMPIPGESGFFPPAYKMIYGPPMEIAEIKAEGDDWIVEGYPSTFGNVDLGRDMVIKGAFTHTLKENKGRIRFLLAHDPRQILGVPQLLKEDNHGLFGKFKISQTQLGADTHLLLQDGAIDQFSIGYKAVDWEIVDEDVRQLKKVDLYEVSLVPMAMNPDALVTRVKDALGMMTLADRANYLGAETFDLLNDLRGLIDGIDRPLSNSKQSEFKELLALCAGWDAVRTDLQDILNAATQSNLVEAHKTKHQLARLRKRLAEQGEITCL